MVEFVNRMKRIEQRLILGWEMEIGLPPLESWRNYF
jgi:hypothetical protein